MGGGSCCARPYVSTLAAVTVGVAARGDVPYDTTIAVSLAPSRSAVVVTVRPGLCNTINSSTHTAGRRVSSRR